MYRIIFVCHGNICRSPAAEFVLVAKLSERGLENQVSVCSRATSFEEIGNDTYPPMKRALKEAGIPFYPHQARRIDKRDYEQADAIYYMDGNNRAYLGRILDDPRRIIHSIARFSPQIGEIDDPWYTGRYEEVLRQISTCVDAILEHTLDELNIA